MGRDGEIALKFDNQVETIIVPKQVLTLASPVFKQMLQHDTVQKNIRTINLKQKDPKQFKVLVTFLMPATSRMQKITVKNADFLLDLTNEYCIEPIKQECIDFIKTQPPTVDRVLQAYRFGINDYFEECTTNLIKGGEKEWGPCTENPDLLRRIFELSLEILQQTKIDTEDDFTIESFTYKNPRLYYA